MISIELRVVVFWDEVAWVAHCLDYDIAAQGGDLDELMRRLTLAVKSECDNGRDWFVMLPKAPDEVWELWFRVGWMLKPDWAIAGRADWFEHKGCQFTFLMRIATERPKKAVVAVAASILTAAYHILKDDTTYQELGPDHFERRDKAHLTKRLLKRLHDLGVNVEVTPAA